MSLFNHSFSRTWVGIFFFFREGEDWRRGGGIEEEEEEEGCGWRSGSVIPHKVSRTFFSLTLLQQQTKRKMEKSLCALLAAVVFLGGFLDAALIDDATTEIYLLFNNTTDKSVTVQTDRPTPTTEESVTVETHRPTATAPEPVTVATDHPTTTTAETKVSTATVRDKQLDTKTISKDSEEENNHKEEEADDSKTEEKTGPGRKSRAVFELIKPHDKCYLLKQWNAFNTWCLQGHTELLLSEAGWSHLLSCHSAEILTGKKSYSGNYIEVKGQK